MVHGGIGRCQSARQRFHSDTHSSLPKENQTTGGRTADKVSLFDLEIGDVDLLSFSHPFEATKQKSDSNRPASTKNQTFD